MREIVLDTETTGLSPEKGDRVVEIGCVELFNHVPTGKTFQTYLNPERLMDAGAQEIHGLTDDFLKSQPIFLKIVDEFLSFIGESTLVIHNAKFDLAFMNNELNRIGRENIEFERAIDTLSIARKKFPGAQNNLDALCRRFDVDSSRRDLHGALLDSEILAEVYLELIGGKEPDLNLVNKKKEDSKKNTNTRRESNKRDTPLNYDVSQEEEAEHLEFIQNIKNPIWNKS
ncbi:MAG: DNA polymerase III subunit epsilon [Rhodobiaceae bacterium]|nr:DNA polymerase III subunit epsilon [Rhodobiaceae bacterium]